MKFKILITLLIASFTIKAFAKEDKTKNVIPSSYSNKTLNNVKKRKPKYRFTYIERDHTINESIHDIGFMYSITWLAYIATQPSTVKNHGSLKNYKDNFGNFVLDNDEPIWNWVIHPLSGSQLYLYYRAKGYTKSNSLAMAFVSSTLFELTVEIYTEPASIQDLYQTPILGSVVGYGIENLSFYLLNTGNPIGRFFGHLINPFTLFPFYDGKIAILPHYNGKKSAGLTFKTTF